MHERACIVASPADSDQLILLFHGVGATARDLLPLGEALEQARPRATVVCVEAPHASSWGSGYEWFSVAGITEDSRPARIAEAMVPFLATVRHWQGQSGVGPAHTVLLGFSQGAIVALESTQATLQPDAAAHTVIALAGRFAVPVRRAPPEVAFHLIHGDSDGVVLPRWSADAARQLQALGGRVTHDRVPGLGHGIDARVLRRVLELLPAGD